MGDAFYPLLGVFRFWRLGVVDFSSNSSKHSGRLEDLNFHSNVVASRTDQAKSQNVVFSMVTLGISQRVFPEQLSRLFADREFGLSLLSNGKRQYAFTAKDEFVDCPVFLQGRTPQRQPEKEVVSKKKSLRHPSDAPAWGQQHRAMHTEHLKRSLRVISHRLGLLNHVTSRTFRTSFAHKGVIDGKIPAWRLSRNMGHFSVNKGLHRHIYVPKFGPVDTTRSNADDGAARSEGVRHVLDTNGAVTQLPHPDDADLLFADPGRQEQGQPGRLAGFLE